MFFHQDEAVQSSCFPVLETMFTPSEIEDLFSLVNEPASPGSGSQGSNRAVRSPHERKLRRMQSNRESARRSRWRKKRHLENLTNQVNRLKMENRELKNRLCFTMHQNLLLSVENESLRSESVTLMATLSDLYQFLGTMISDYSMPIVEENGGDKNQSHTLSEASYKWKPVYLSTLMWSSLCPQRTSHILVDYDTELWKRSRWTEVRRRKEVRRRMDVNGGGKSAMDVNAFPGRV
ncbi:hypothetical protein VNO78_28919 [Psophocarpus tetragonolobus]|uniref:BZIP domain-containing protein n=1 Tax=Psophocarpus tetragonolobus TaxID=3891 RepID=A0AAN9RU06_PSOTE